MRRNFSLSGTNALLEESAIIGGVGGISSTTSRAFIASDDFDSRGSGIPVPFVNFVGKRFVVIKINSSKICCTKAPYVRLIKSGYATENLNFEGILS
jgi:hypothetical protein